MKLPFLATSSLGVSAMLVAMCGYAATRTAPKNLQLVSAGARLIQNIDTKDVAPGQLITAKLTSNVKDGESMDLPKGTMLIGKVEHVQMSKDKGPAKLSLVFDQAKLSDGKTIPVKATLLAAYPADAGSYWAPTGDSVLPSEPHFISPKEQIDQEPGVLSHVALHSAVASKASGVFVSKDRDINLKSGTQFQIALAPATTANS